jgi:hypothetical protein
VKRLRVWDSTYFAIHDFQTVSSCEPPQILISWASLWLSAATSASLKHEHASANWGLITRLRAYVQGTYLHWQYTRAPTGSRQHTVNRLGMSAGTCSHDCSRRLTELSPEPDITGIGVSTSSPLAAHLISSDANNKKISLSYTITAGLAVLIVILYYIFAYSPHSDPFSGSSKDAGQQSGRVHQPNPIDTYILFWRSPGVRKGASIASVAPVKLRRINPALTQVRFPTCFNQTRTNGTKCMLIMSDLQLITGLTIMLSGFLQLNCGLSTYHWQRVIRLAWFSSVTHLCCLTFLRDYLRENKMLQIWRIPSMAMLSILLIFAFTTTSQYDWKPSIAYQMSEPSEHLAVRPYDQAICVMRSAKILKEVMVTRSGQRMIVSIILLATGMISRIVRLYQPSHIAVANCGLGSAEKP